MKMRSDHTLEIHLATKTTYLNSKARGKLIYSSLSGIFEKVMRLGGHFSYFIKRFKHYLANNVL